ncbi:hypothetical protein GY45DRAFT_1325271 [Cubamyces sp. BRFM 1775]|nr:hypothetical protein GY45DRAFT_1325271 [Cubamyces sp. BRFM 1775]
MRIRRATGTADPTYQWQEKTDPSRVGWPPSANPGSTYPAQGPPKSLPDVPLNADHRYCTPPPMDPRFIDQPREKDEFPQYQGRHSFPGGFEEVKFDQYFAAPDGSKNNPYVVEDDENARRHREVRRQSMHSSKSGSSSRSSSESTYRQPLSTMPVPTRKAPPPPSRSPVASSSSSSSSRTTRSVSSTGPATPPGVTPIGRAKYQKTAADGFTPKASSPLKQVAYAASTRTNTPVSNAWYVPPKKQSTGSIAVAESESSSDSEYSD